MAMGSDRAGRRYPTASGKSFVPDATLMHSNCSRVEPVMDHPELLHPASLARFSSEKMTKVDIFRSDRMLVGLNAFEAGQEHALHGHADQDKVYHVLEGEGEFLLEERTIEMSAGAMLVAPAGVPHGVRNTGHDRLVVLVFMAPAPSR